MRGNVYLKRENKIEYAEWLIHFQNYQIHLQLVSVLQTTSISKQTLKSDHVKAEDECTWLWQSRSARQTLLTLMGMQGDENSKAIPWV